MHGVARAAAVGSVEPHGAGSENVAGDGNVRPDGGFSPYRFHL